MNPAGSFFKFLIGFLVFITASFVLTFVVGTYSIDQERARDAAAALKAVAEGH
jgi:hypothetical protein